MQHLRARRALLRCRVHRMVFGVHHCGGGVEESCPEGYLRNALVGLLLESTDEGRPDCWLRGRQRPSDSRWDTQTQGGRTGPDRITRRDYREVIDFLPPTLGIDRRIYSAREFWYCFQGNVSLDQQLNLPRCFARWPPVRIVAVTHPPLFGREAWKCI
jgi:hypothetical protein